jgi:hypothetical protein
MFRPDISHCLKSLHSPNLPVVKYGLSIATLAGINSLRKQNFS